MAHARFSPLLTATVAICVATMLAACAPSGTGTANNAAPADSAAEDDGAGADDAAPASGGIDTLESDSLHVGVESAAAGTAYIEIEGERLEFPGIECSITDKPDGDAVNIIIESETSHGPTELRILRGIGWGVGFDYEEELVQVSVLGGEVAQISMAQNSGDEDGGIEWQRGGGPDPLLAMVGSEVTATGTLDGHPGSDQPVAGEFVMAANCG